MYNQISLFLNKYIQNAYMLQKRYLSYNKREYNFIIIIIQVTLKIMKLIIGDDLASFLNKNKFMLIFKLLHNVLGMGCQRVW